VPNLTPLKYNKIVHHINVEQDCILLYIYVG